MRLYEVIADPPSETGAVKDTSAEFGPVKTGAPTTGAPGGEAGLGEGVGVANRVDMELDDPEAAESPKELEAITENKYAVFGDSPETRIVPDPDCFNLPTPPGGEETIE